MKTGTQTIIGLGCALLLVVATGCSAKTHRKAHDALVTSCEIHAIAEGITSSTGLDELAVGAIDNDGVEEIVEVSRDALSGICGGVLARAE